MVSTLIIIALCAGFFEISFSYGIKWFPYQQEYVFLFAFIGVLVFCVFLDYLAWKHLIRLVKDE